MSVESFRYEISIVPVWVLQLSISILSLHSLSLFSVCLRLLADRRIFFLTEHVCNIQSKTQCQLFNPLPPTSSCDKTISEPRVSLDLFTKYFSGTFYWNTTVLWQNIIDNKSLSDDGDCRTDLKIIFSSIFSVFYQLFKIRTSINATFVHESLLL